MCPRAFIFLPMILLASGRFVNAAVPVPPAEFLKENAGFESNSGFLKIFAGGGARIEMRGTRMKDAGAAKQKVLVDLAAIRRQFEPRGNPYAGQITELVKCDRKYSPLNIALRGPTGTTVEAVMGGVGARRSFGACDASKFESWGMYFAFFDADTSMVIEARIFQNLKERETAKAALTKTANALLTSAGNRP